MKAFRLFSVAHDLLVTLVRAGRFNPKRIFRFLLLSFYLSFFQSIALADTTHISNSKSGEEADSSNSSNHRPVTDRSIAPTGNQKAQEIKDSAGNLIGLLEGNEIKNSQGEVIGKVVKNDKGEITSTLWNIDKLGNLPESSLLKQKFNALKQDITKLKKEAEQRIGRLNDEIQGADKDAKSVSDELTKLADDWRTAFFTYYTGTLTGLEQSYQAHVRHGNSLRSQKTLEESTLKKVNQLIEDGNLSEAHAVLSGKEQQFKNAMGNIYGQSFRDLKGANQQLAAAVESANRWESGLNTTKNVAVVGGAIIATGGLASFGLVAAAAGGTAAGTAIGAASNYIEASQQVAFGNMTREEAYQRAHERTRQDALTSAQIGISGGVAGTVARGTQGLLGVERATTLSGRLVTGATAGGTSGLAGSLLNTGGNLATGNETRTTTQILVDTGAQTLVGATSGVFGAASQYKLDRLATQQSGSNTVTQQLLIRGVGEVVGPTALSTAGTLAAHKLTGREGPTSEELIANAGVNVIGAVTGAQVSARANKTKTDESMTTLKTAYLEPEQIQKLVTELEQKATSSGRGQSNNGFAAEAEQARAMAEYQGDAYKVRMVDGPTKTFPNGNEGQFDAELTIFPSANKGVDANVDSKGRGLDVAQIQKYRSTGTKSIFVVKDEKALNNVGVLAKIKTAFDGNIDQARGQVFVMTREQYLNFLKTGNISPSFKSFLSSSSGGDIPLTHLSPEQESKLFFTLSRIPTKHSNAR